MSVVASSRPHAWRRGRPTRRASLSRSPTLALTLAHTGARVSEALTNLPGDIDREATAIRVRNLKRCAERWHEVPVPPELLRALELFHAVRSTPAKAAGKPL